MATIVESWWPLTCQTELWQCWHKGCPEFIFSFSISHDLPWAYLEIAISSYSWVFLFAWIFLASLCGSIISWQWLLSTLLCSSTGSTLLSSNTILILEKGYFGSVIYCTFELLSIWISKSLTGNFSMKITKLCKLLLFGDIFCVLDYNITRL